MEERARAEEQSAQISEERERTLRNIIRAYEDQRSRATIAQLEGKLTIRPYTCRYISHLGVSEPAPKVEYVYLNVDSHYTCIDSVGCHNVCSNYS